MSRFAIIICLLILVIGAFVISGFAGFFEHKNNTCVSNNPEYIEKLMSSGIANRL